MKRLLVVSVGLAALVQLVRAEEIDWSQAQELTEAATITGTEGTDYSQSANAITVTGVTGTETLTLKNVGLIAPSHTTITISAPVSIPEGSTVYLYSYRNGNGDRFFDLTGGLSGAGKLYCSAANSYGGVRIAGDCSGFTGEIHVVNVGHNRMKFMGDVDLSNATVYLHGSVADNGSFINGGTVKIGKFVIDENATPQMKADKAMTLLVGNLESADWTLPFINFTNFGNVKLVNAGTQKMTLAAGYNGKSFNVLGSPQLSIPTGPIDIPENVRIAETETSVLTNIVGEGTFVLAPKNYRATSSNANTWRTDLNFLVKRVSLANGTTIAQWANGTTGEASAPNYSITLANDLEIAAGYSRLIAWQHNYAVTGNLSGEGTLYAESEKRGVFLSGDNHEFAGTCTNHIKGADYVVAGFVGSASGSAAARWVLSGTASANRGGSERSYLIEGTTEAAPIHLGALDVPNAATKVQIRQANDKDTTPGAMVIGERTTAGDTDSFFNGTFNKNALHLVKDGAGSTLTLGTDAVFADNSTIGVTNGTLVVNTANLANVPVVVAAGAAIGGTGSISNLTLAEGAKLAGDTSLLVKDYAGPAAVLPVDAGVVVKGGKKGRYRAVVRTEDGMTRLSCAWYQSGFMIVFK